MCEEGGSRKRDVCRARMKWGKEGQLSGKENICDNHDE